MASIGFGKNISFKIEPYFLTITKANEIDGMLAMLLIETKLPSKSKPE